MAPPILLTGGAGFVGSHIADRLVAAGFRVRALVRPTSDVSHLPTLPGLELVRGHLEAPDSLEEAVRGVQGVIHAAGLIKALRTDDFRRVNDEGTGNLLKATRIAGMEGLRFVHVSSLAALGPSPDSQPRPPGAPPEPVSAYGRSKLAAEERVRAAADGLHTVVIRPPIVHGPRDRETLALFQAVKYGIWPTTGPAGQVLSMVWAGDCADACVRALTADVPSGACFDIEDGKPERLEAVVGHIEAALGRRARVRLPVPRAALAFAALATEGLGKVRGRAVMFTRDKVRELTAPNWVCDGSAARRALGWAPRVSFAEGARISVAWYRAAGWL